MNQFNKNQKIWLAIIFVIIAGIIGYYIYGGENEETVNVDNMMVKENVVSEEMEEESMIIVHITGAVQKEGIVKLRENARVADAIEAAGGTTQLVDMSKINLAYVLEDGMKIYIPSIKDKKEDIEQIEGDYLTETKNEIISTENVTKKSNGKVNINTATEQELDSLPGIGPATASKIIQYREETGKFKKIEDIKNVKGIGNSKFENIKEQISVK